MRLARGWIYSNARQQWTFYRAGKKVVIVAASALREMPEEFFLTHGLPAPGVAMALPRTSKETCPC